MTPDDTKRKIDQSSSELGRLHPISIRFRDYNIEIELYADNYFAKAK